MSLMNWPAIALLGRALASAFMNGRSSGIISFASGEGSSAAHAVRTRPGAGRWR